jgi:hypothetical protein
MTSTIDSGGEVIRSDRRGRMLVKPEQREDLLDEFAKGERGPKAKGVGS